MNQDSSADPKKVDTQAKRARKEFITKLLMYDSLSTRQQKNVDARRDFFQIRPEEMIPLTTAQRENFLKTNTRRLVENMTLRWYSSSVVGKRELLLIRLR